MTQRQSVVDRIHDLEVAIDALALNHYMADQSIANELRNEAHKLRLLADMSPELFRVLKEFIDASRTNDIHQWSAARVNASCVISRLEASL